MRRRGAGPGRVIERSVHIGRPVETVVDSFRGDPQATPPDVSLAVDEPALLVWEFSRRGLRGSRLSLSFAPEDGGTRVTSRFEPHLGGLVVRLRRHRLTRRYEQIVEGVLERSRSDLEGEAGDVPGTRPGPAAAGAGERGRPGAPDPEDGGAPETSGADSIG